MAFASKYYVNWVDVNGVACIVDIQEDGFAGSSTELDPGLNPLIIRWNQSDKYQQIIGSHAEIYVVYTSTVDEIYEANNQELRVHFFYDGTVEWIGFISPGQYFRAFNEVSTIAKLVANDGLGDLKNIKFEDSGDPYWGKQTEIIAISNILQKTGLELIIREAINIFDTNHNTTAADSALAQTYLDADAYWDEQTDERANCYDVLTDILKKYGATIKQSSKRWNISRPNTYSKNTIAYRHFTYLGVYSNNSTFTSFNTIDSTHFYTRVDHEITRRIGVGDCEVTQVPPRRSNMFKNGNFNSFTWDGSDFDHWTETGTVDGYAEDSDTLKIGSCNNATPNYSDYIETNVNVYYADSVTLSFDWTPTYSGSPTYKTLILQIYSSDPLYLTPTGWQSAVGYYSITAGATGTEDRISIDIPATRASGKFLRGFDLRVRIYEFHNENTLGSGNYFNLDNLRLEVDMGIPDYKLHTYSNSANINFIKEIDIRLGDSWRTDFFGSATEDDAYYVNTYTTGGNPTTLWSIFGDPTAGAPIGEVLARQTVEGYRRSLDLMRGTIRALEVTNMAEFALTDAVFVDEYGFKKRFLCQGVDWNTTQNEWNGEWIECPATYEDESLDWNTDDYSVSAITANEIDINTPTVSGTQSATSDSFTAAQYEVVRVYITVVDAGTSDPPNYSIDSQTGTLAFGINQLEFIMATAGSKTFQINHTAGEKANCVVTFKLYTMKGY